MELDGRGDEQKHTALSKAGTSADMVGKIMLRGQSGFTRGTFIYAESPCLDYKAILGELQDRLVELSLLLD